MSRQRTTRETPVEVDVDGIRVSVLDRDQTDHWDRLVERSPMGTAFHRYAALETVASHSESTFYPLVGHKGQEVIGLFPVFELRQGPFATVFSPPPEMGLPLLGPVMADLDQLKRRRAEKRTKRFLEAAIEWIERVVSPSFVHLRSHPDFPDTRPLRWAGFELAPQFTYVVDLSGGPEAVLGEFSSDARRNVKHESDRVEIEERDADAIPAVLDHLAGRHADQGLEFPVDAAFATDLSRSLPDGTFRTYVCTVDGAYATGMVAVTDADTVYRWQGGARPLGDGDLPPVNDMLDWRMMLDAIDAGQTAYDLVGANTPALCEYKSKFGPELVTYQAAERGTRLMRLTANLYRRLK